MVTPLELHEATLARLRAIPQLGGRIFDEEVKKPAADAQGAVLPYVILWPTPGTYPDDARSAAKAWGSELDWTASVIAAGGSTQRALLAAAWVRTALAGWHAVPPPAGPLVETQFTRPLPVQKEPDVSPARYFLPMQFGCLTP